LAAYVEARMVEVDVDAADLDRCDEQSPEFDIAMRHGMATAFHEVLHLLWDLRNGQTAARD
jgi:hypothetical protein